MIYKKNLYFYIMNDLSPYTFELGQYKNQKVIFIRFEKDRNLITIVKQLIGSRWSQTLKCWYVPDVKEYRKLFNISLDYTISTKVLHKINGINTLQLNIFIQQLKLKGYSPNTIRAYTNEFIQFLIFLDIKSVTTCTETDVKDYLLHCIDDLKLKENTLHSRINAIKFYFEKVQLFKKIEFEIPRPKKHKKLPKALNISEVKLILIHTPNLKHNTILKMCYGMGLRLSEIINLKIDDIDSQSMRVFIERSKGKKDRYVNLPESILEQLRLYYKEFKPKEYLFEGQYGGQYSARSVQNVFKNSLQKAGIQKQIGIHSLRHSYATHLLEKGTDIRFIQELLGHNDIKTTLIYTNVTDISLRKIISPLDML